MGNRGVTICPGHDTVRISILGSRYDTYHDILNKIENDDTEIQITGLFQKFQNNLLYSN